MFRGLHTQSDPLRDYILVLIHENDAEPGIITADAPCGSAGGANYLNTSFSTFQGIRLNENARTGRGSLPPPEAALKAREPCAESVVFHERKRITLNSRRMA